MVQRGVSSMCGYYGLEVDRRDSVVFNLDPMKAVLVIGISRVWDRFIIGGIEIADCNKAGLWD